MVGFGAKLEEARQAKWAFHYADYDRLKQLLSLASKALQKEAAVVDAHNFIEEGGLLDNDRQAAVKLLHAGVSDKEAQLLVAAYESGGIISSESHWSRTLLRSGEASLAWRLLAFDVAIACEFRKAWTHYRRHLDLLEVKWTYHLREDIRPRRTSDSSGGEGSALLSKDEEGGGRREKVSLKRAIGQLHEDALDLLDFCTWNWTALIKIAKKRDKVFHKEPAIKRAVSQQVHGLQGAQLRPLIEAIRAEFARLFCDGDEAAADWQLRQLHKDDPDLTYSREAIRLGYRAGVAAMLAVWVLWDCIEVVGGSAPSVATKPGWPIFRALGELCAWHWLWGFQLKVWSDYRVNVDFLFDCDGSPSAYEVHNEAAGETIVLLALLLAYYKATYDGGLPSCLTAYIKPRHVATYAPMLAVVFALYRLAMPWARRKHMWRALGRVVVAPCVPVKFLDTYVADVLSSMVKILLDALWSLCFFGTGDFVVSGRSRRHTSSLLPSCTQSKLYSKLLAPMVCLAPVWFRFAQCLRKHRDLENWSRIHLANAAKYALSMLVSLSSALEPTPSRLWLGIFCCSSAYSWLWDVTIDWGLLDPSRHRLYPSKSWGPLDLSRHRLYPNKSWYVVAAAVDLVGRFVWLTTLLPPSPLAKTMQVLVPDYVVPLLAIAELARRCLWSVFRLENEHVSNAFQNRPYGQFVPSHFRRAQPEHRTSPASRFQSALETTAVATLVLTLLVRISMSSARQSDAQEAGADDNFARWDQSTRHSNLSLPLQLQQRDVL